MPRENQWQISGSVGSALHLHRWSIPGGSEEFNVTKNSLLEHSVMAWLQQDPSGNYHISFRFVNGG